MASAEAVSEITKASRCEALRLPNEYKLFYAHINTVVFDLHKKSEGKYMEASVPHMCSVASDPEPENANSTDVKIQLQHLEDLLFKFRDKKRYRRMVGSLAGSCLKATTPMISSMKVSTCLLALDIVEIQSWKVLLTYVKIQLQRLEDLLFKLHDKKRYRRMVGSLAESCLKAATPLISSFKASACLLALDTVELRHSGHIDD